MGWENRYSTPVALIFDNSINHPGPSPRPGNEITGTYSLYRSDTDTGTVFAVANAGGSLTTADTGTGDGSGTATVTTYSSDNSTSTRTGSELTGSYSLHETDGSTATAYESDAAGDEFAAADGEAGADTAGDTATTYEADSTTLDRSGSETSGDYSLHRTDTSTATAYDVSTAGGTDTAADTSSGGGSATVTAYSSGSETEILDRTFSGLTGSYSLHRTDNSTATASTTETDGGSAGFADGSSDGGGGTATGTSYETDGTTLDRTGNETTGSYSLHETDGSTATEYGLSTDGGSVTLAGGSTDGGSGGGTGTVISVDNSTADRTGSDSTGAYSLHETGAGGGTVFLDGASGTGSLTGADGAAGTDGGGGSGTEYDSDSYTLDETGNDATGTYSLHETGADGSTAFETVAEQIGFTPPGGPADTEAGSLTVTTFDADTYTRDESGDAAGFYSMLETDSDSGTAYQTGGGAATVGSDVDAASETATVYSSGHSTVTQTGDATGAYSLHRTDDSTATDFETGTERGQDGTSTSVTTDSGTVDENGNGAAGDYTLTESGGGTTTLVHAEGTDARGTYTASGVSTYSGNGGDTGNAAKETGSPTAYQSGSSTVTIVGGDGTNQYTRTVTSSGGSSAPGGWDPTSGVATGTTTGSSTVTVSEYGTGAAGSYTLTDVETSSGSSAATTNLLTGAYTLTDDGTTGSSLHEEGWEGTAGSFTLDKTATGYNDSTTTGDPRTGEYSLSGTFGSTSTATETNYHGSDSATFTEILTEDGTAAETGNGNTGDYSRHEWGSQGANFVQDGTTAPGSVHVTEGSAGSFDRTGLGNSGTGGYTLSGTTDTGYSATETVSGSETYTVTAAGTDSNTGSETGDRITGGYTRTESGTDGFTLAESGSLTTGSVDETVTGTDSYGVSESGDHGKGTYDSTTTGGGGWTRTGDGASSGTSTYTQSLSGNDLAGHFSASETGTDRYALVDRFADVSNTAPGTTTPGNVTVYSHGLPLRDPVLPPAAPGAWAKLDPNDVARVWKWWNGLSPQEQADVAAKLKEIQKAGPQPYGSTVGNGGTRSVAQLQADYLFGRIGGAVGGVQLTQEEIDAYNAFRTEYNKQAGAGGGGAAAGPMGTPNTTLPDDGRGGTDPVAGRIFGDLAAWTGVKWLIENTAAGRAFAGAVRDGWYGTDPPGGHRIDRAEGAEAWVPLWGSYKNYLHDLERGAYLRAGWDYFLFLLDLGMVKSALTLGGKGVSYAAGKLGGTAAKGGAGAELAAASKGGPAAGAAADGEAGAWGDYLPRGYAKGTGSAGADTAAAAKGSGAAAPKSNRSRLGIAAQHSAGYSSRPHDRTPSRDCRRPRRDAGLRLGSRSLAHRPRVRT